MAGDILIFDGVATNRIVLKVKLLAAQYRVRPCATVEEARIEIAACPPDLIILDTSSAGKEVIELCGTLKAREATNLIPIIATGCFPTPRERVVALKAGADDVLTKPFDDQILQARIRSLLRARDAKEELRMREGTRTALGFAEAMGGFEMPAKVVVAAEGGALNAEFHNFIRTQPNLSIESASVEGLMRGPQGPSPTDLFVLDFRHTEQSESALYRLLSELRSRSVSRHAALLVILPHDANQAAALALDLGANDVIFSNVDGAEIGHRCAALIRAKRDADALRRTVETSLEAAVTDPLTGLYNRRYALPHLSRLSAQSRKTERQFAVMVLDIDHFKSINDTYGHQVGDEVLCQVANRLSDNLRAVDLLARIGGEEFLVAIPDSDAVHARTAGERLCKLIRDTPFYVGPDREAVRVTVSVGVSLSAGDDASDVQSSLDDLVNEADLALYAAKSGGRDKVSLSAA